MNRLSVTPDNHSSRTGTRALFVRAFSLRLPCSIAAIVMAALALASCSGDSDDAESTDATERASAAPASHEEFLDTAGGIAIYIDIESGVSDAIKVTQADSKSPGLKNPIETFVSLKNVSDTPQKVLVSAAWEDGHGRGFGGLNSPLLLEAGETHSIHTGTRAENVTTYRVSVSRSVQTEVERRAEVLSDPAVQVAEGYGMTYSETAQDEVIPALPVFGFANGEPFEGLTVTFNFDFGKWRVEISDAVFDPVKGSGIARFDNKNLQTISINLPEEPESGQKMGREMAYGGGMFQIRDPGKEVPTTSWNTSFTWAIEFESWNKGETGQGPCAKREVGSASGKLYAAFAGSDFSFENSWVSGAFSNAPVIYCGSTAQPQGDPD